MKKIVGAIFLAVFALTGCSTVSEGEKKTNNKLCTGTKRPYQVKGNWYTPQEHYEYEEEGVASWYGPKFHGRPKSCGEIFNMHGISAAHKTLPIPSVVRVTNVRDGSNVKLLVDDRGPFVDNRIIDLSKGAATYLGICDQGLGKVRVECLPEESKAFAKFVSQYGRYGRDPSGRSWETIFREQFDSDCTVSAPKPLRAVYSRRVQRRHKLAESTSAKNYQPFRRPSVKTMPVSGRKFKKPEYEIEDEVNDREIEELLAETRTYLGRKRA